MSSASILNFFSTNPKKLKPRAPLKRPTTKEIIDLSPNKIASDQLKTKIDKNEDKFKNEKSESKNSKNEESKSKEPDDEENEESESKKSEDDESESEDSENEESESDDSDNESKLEEADPEDIEICESDYGPSNEFGVRFKFLIKCDGKCPKGECICALSSGRGIQVPINLLPHQPTAIKWMIKREANPLHGIRGGINCASMSTGKTMMTLTTIMRDYALPKTDINYPKYPTLIVCPLANINDPWEDQITKFFGPSCPYFVFRQDSMGKDLFNSITLKQIQKYRIVITNYDVIKTVARKHRLLNDIIDSDPITRKTLINKATAPTPKMMKKMGDIMVFGTPWHRIVFDEGPESFANPATIAFKSVMRLYAPRTWVLSGTPIRNRVSDIWSQFRVCGFSKIMVPKQFNISTYLKYGLNNCVLSLSLDDAGIKLPGMEVKDVFIELKEREKESYDYWASATRHAYQRWAVGCLNYANVLTLFLRQRQACVASYTITPESSRGYVENSEQKHEYTEAQKKLNEMTAGLSDWISDKEGTAGIQSAKVSEVIRIIRDEAKGDEVLVFSNFKKVLDVIESALKTELPDVSYSMVDGDITGDDRNQAINSFKKGKAQVLLMSYKVGSVGLNLVKETQGIVSESETKGNAHVIMVECVWTPAVIKQAAARIYRVGQMKKVIAWQLITKGTIEEAMMLTICRTKQDLADSFLDGKRTKHKDGQIDAKLLKRLLEY